MGSCLIVTIVLLKGPRLGSFTTRKSTVFLVFASFQRANKEALMPKKILCLVMNTCDDCDSRHLSGDPTVS